MVRPKSDFSDAVKPCFCCELDRVGTYCLNCERWVCWKHCTHRSAWQPDRFLCDPCAALPPLTRRSIERDSAPRRKARR